MVTKQEAVELFKRNPYMNNIQGNIFINEEDPKNRMMYEVGNKWLTVSRYWGKWKTVYKVELKDITVISVNKEYY